MGNSRTRLIPIYTSKGDAEAFLLYPNIFNRNGDWIGVVTPKPEGDSVLGVFVGTLTIDPRFVSKRATATLKPRFSSPPKPQRVYPPATIPLAPLMADLSHSTIDVLLEAPERLHTLDAGEQRQDMD